MRLAVRLVCPICDWVVSDGPEPRAGECPNCGAAYAGDGDSAPAAVGAALVQLGIDGLDATALTNALFGLAPGSGAQVGAAVTSDSRDDDFYRWWLFVRGPASEAREVLAALL